MDTGATSHLMNGSGIDFPFIDWHSYNSHIMVGDGTRIPVKACGTMALPKPFAPLALKNILYTPHIVKNLVSVRKFTSDNNVSVEFDPFGFSVKDLRTGNLLTRCNSVGSLYPLSSNKASSSSAFAALSSDVWHNRLGHPGDHVLRFLRSNKIIDCNKGPSLHVCHGCQLGKHCRLPFSDSTTRTSSPFDIIHTDLFTYPINSHTGFRYYLLFLDDYSHYLWVFPLKSKTAVYDTFVHFHKYVQTQFGYFIKALQCDNGREYDNNRFTLFSSCHGMIWRYSCPHTSPQNGKVERMIRTINNVCRSLLFHASLPSSYWVESLHTASYLLNIRPTRLLGNLTPVHILYHRAPTYDHIRTFGCLCYLNVFATASNKMSPRSTPCIFLGYPLSHRGYRCLDIQTKKIIISRHVVFNESTFPYSSNYTPQLSDLDFFCFLTSTHLHLLF